MNEFLVSPQVRAVIVHCSPTAPGTDFFRSIIELYATEPSSEAGKLYKEYEVWVPLEVVEDRLRLSRGATIDDIYKFIKNILIGRYKDSSNKIPHENGILFKSMYDIVLGNPNTFPLKLDDKKRLVKTTILLSEDTHQWLKEYGAMRNVGLGESIRRVVADFQLGTASRDNTQTTINNSPKGGVPELN